MNIVELLIEQINSKSLKSICFQPFNWLQALTSSEANPALKTGFVSNNSFDVTAFCFVSMGCVASKELKWSREIEKPK